jgi:hypothetical protein
MRLTDLGDNVHELLVDILQRGTVAIVVDVELDKGLGVLTQADKDSEDERFLANGRVLHFQYRDEYFVQQHLDLFLTLSVTVSHTDCRSPTFICARIDLSIHQNISTLSSKTWLTGLTAFLDRLRQRYCLVAWRKGVFSIDVVEGILINGLTNKSACDLRIVKTKWSDRSLERIGEDRRSLSLEASAFLPILTSSSLGVLTSR